MEVNTQLLPANEKSLSLGAELLQQGKLVVFPTETVYGIGANALNVEATQNIFKAKGRPQDNPLIVHVATIEQVKQLVDYFPSEAEKLANAFWPGPLTIILPKNNIIPSVVSADLDTIAIRIPSHPVALELLKKSKLPIAAPSANRSGLPSPTIAKYVMDDLNGFVDLIIDGGSSNFGVESTVISLVNRRPVLLRPGAITPKDLEHVIGKIEIDDGVLQQLDNNKTVLSPGMKYKHYAPKADVFLVHGSRTQYIDFCNNIKETNSWAMAFDEEKSLLMIPTITYGPESDSLKQASNIFTVLRILDEHQAKIVYVHAPNTDGVGLAVYNRLLRAAAFQEIIL